MEKAEVEIDYRVVQAWPDGSEIRTVRYRADPQAPWIQGPFEAHCGDCKDIVTEQVDETDARVAMLEHLLLDVQNELSSMRSAFLRAGGYRAR